MSDPSTQPPKPEKPDEDEDRTILFRPDEPAKGSDESEVDPDRTVIAPRHDPAAVDKPEDPAPDPDRTIIASTPTEPNRDEVDSEPDTTVPPQAEAEAEAEEADRTVISPMPGQGGPTAAETPPEDDPDRTVLSPMPGGSAEDSESAEEQPDADRTILATPQEPDAAGDSAPPKTDPEDGTDPPEGADAQTHDGSTYRPMSEITSGNTPPSGTDAPQGTGAPTQEGVFGTQSVEGTATLGSIVPPPPGTAPTPLSSLEPGTIINNMYRVEERLDQGGMGRVFRGVEIGTGESVAIKVILPEMAEDVKVAQMFRREARTLRQLHHDAIVRYFAYVPPDQNLNLHALVMGFIEGTKLSDKLKAEGALKREQVLELTLRLASGLDRAHSNGIVHRDLSPDNIMLPDDDISKAVLIDFGISRSSRIKDVTIGNEFAGKLKYVSPEQLGDFGGEAEAPSDVYSLGLLMMAMLTGKAAAMGDTIVEAVQKRQTVPDLSEIPVEFHDVLTKMLEPNPEHRLRSMSAVIEELRELDDSGTGFGTRSRMGGRTGMAAKDRAVPGLQAVPIGKSISGGAGSTDAPTFQTSATPADAEKGGKGLLLAAMLGLAVVAGGAYFAMQNGVGGTNGGGGSVTPDEAVAEGLERLPESREAFLATALPEGCVFATRRQQGGNAGLIEGYTDSASRLRGVGDAFAAEYSAAPDVIERNIPPAQCAVLEFVRSFQGTRGSRIEIALDEHVAARGDGVIGRVFGSDGRQNWLSLVDANGRVFSLMRQFDDPIGNERRFAFRLPSAPPGKYLLVATASEDTLVRAGAMQDGTTASEIFPLMLRELAQDGQGAVDIAYLELTP